MTWVRLDEQFPRHPKIVQAGPLGMALHVSALCYCNEFLTDGAIPRAAVTKALMSCEPHASNEEVAKELVRVGIWDETPDGYHIHDYLEYQPSKQKVQQTRSNKQAAGKAGGQARAKAATPAEPVAESKPVSGPVPVSDSSSEPHPEKRKTLPPQTRRRDEIFDATLQACKMNLAEVTPTARGALNKACKQLREVNATPDEIKKRATRYRDTYPETSLTPAALAKHWPQLGKPASRYTSQASPKDEPEGCEHGTPTCAECREANRQRLRDMVDAAGVGRAP